MSKDIREYLHYYLGCEVAELPKGKHDGMLIDRMTSVNEGGSINVSNGYFMEPGKFKPILRKLESMTEEDAHEICKLATDPKYHDKIQIFEIKNQQIHFMDGTKWQGHGVEEFNDCYVHLKYLSAAQFHYLLSRGFWLFGNDWFDEGLIIDKATVK